MISILLPVLIYSNNISLKKTGIKHAFLYIDIGKRCQDIFIQQKIISDKNKPLSLDDAKKYLKRLYH